MQLRKLRLPLFAVAVVLLDAAVDAPRPADAAAACAAGDCLTNSAVNNRVQPTSVNNDDRGDVMFFASQSGQLPNVVIILDNSTSMYELPYDVSAFPNSAFVNKGTTPNASDTFDTTASTCGGNTFFAGLKDANANPYSKSTTYAPPDPYYDGSNGTRKFFDNNSYYKFLEWAQQANVTAATPTPGGTTTGSAIGFTPGVGNDSRGRPNPGTITGTPNNSCAGLGGSGGSGGTGNNAYTMTQAQRCQQCLDEVGYYIAAGASTTENNSSDIIFKGNWLDFYPPKWIIARKTLTDFIARQSSTPTPTRLGIVTYDTRNVSSTDVPGTSTGFAGRFDGGTFISAGMVPDCGVTAWSGAAAQSQQTSLIAAVRGISFGNSSSPVATPLAETVFNVGQFFTGDNYLYNNAFGSQWIKSGFTAPTGGNKPLCVSCQVNSIVLITDGEPYGDGNLPQTFRNNNTKCPSAGWAPSTAYAAGAVVVNGGRTYTCTRSGTSATSGGPTGAGTGIRDGSVTWNFSSTAIDACPGDQGNSSAALLDDVTNYLATTDLSPDTDSAGRPRAGALTGLQDVITFVIGVGLKVPLLDNAARFGKTTAAMRADSAQELQDEITSAVVNVVARATAFSSTAIQTLEVGTGSTAFVPRFIPGSPTDPIWEGHLYRFDLYNEFVAGHDLDGNGNLDGVFLVDKAGDIITEDDKGAFHKLKNNAPAIPVWDAGDDCNAGPKCTTDAQVTAAHHLNEPGSAANRNMYTAIWDSTNGAWSTVPWPSWDGTGSPPASFTSVVNALGIDGTNACAQIQAAMASPIPAAYLSSTGTFDRNHCAKAIIDYVRGYNVLNEVSGTALVTVNRPRMLGDIFHSSPVVVDPPIDQFICNLGLHAQCVSTLYQYDTNQPVARPDNPTPSATYTVGTETVSAYEKYWRDHETRRRIVLVGANDGMVHAFDAGSPTATPPVLNPNVGFRQVVYDSGTGNEVWAFVPPDQLPRLWLMMRDGHQYYVDGDIMVRDVWKDGAINDKGTAGFTNKPLIKEDVEYHTVAVVSERQGGTHFFALDVTETGTPKMLWTYPLPCSPEEQLWGQTWGQFSPRPAPIGAVMLETTSTEGQPNNGAAHTEERYVAFLNGGHSPFMNRGRIAALVDVYTGAPLFIARYDPAAAPGDPAGSMRFGFPATGALIDYGESDAFTPDGFFDTAVAGDEGGQLWTFRFAKPGKIDSVTNLVTNWTFGRAYEPNSASPNDTRFHQPIYTIAATTAQQETGWLRAYVGTGDRAHVRSQNGGDCRPDDPMSCVNLGCSVNASVTMDSGPLTYASSFTSAGSSSAAAPAMSSPAQSVTTNAANACNRASVTENITVSGSSCRVGTKDASFTVSSLKFSCSGSPLTCTEGSGAAGTVTATFPSPTPNTNRNYGTTPPVGGNTFVSVAVLADATKPRRMNSNPGNDGLTDDGKTYDSNRFTASDLVDVTLVSADARGSITSLPAHPPAGTRANGWTYSYPTIDEKTVTSATILGGCVLWNTLLPGSGAVGCASAGANTASAYQSDPFTGAPTCASSFIVGNNYLRNTTRSVLSPPPEPAAAVAMGAGGSSLRLSMLEIQPGSQEVTQTTVGTSTELLQMLYSVPLTYDQHVCRHVDPLKCE